MERGLELVSGRSPEGVACERSLGLRRPQEPGRLTVVAEVGGSYGHQFEQVDGPKPLATAGGGLEAVAS